MTPHQQRILNALDAQFRPTFAELAQICHSTPASVCQALWEMKRAGVLRYRVERCVVERSTRGDQG